MGIINSISSLKSLSIQQKNIYIFLRPTMCKAYARCLEEHKDNERVRPFL